MARRNVFDPLEPTKEPRWHEVRNMYGALLEAHPLPAGGDLKRAFVAAMFEWIDAGCAIAEFSSRSGVFFCNMGALSGVRFR
jgi:predicted RNA polymerase sigma factor